MATNSLFRVDIEERLKDGLLADYNGNLDGQFPITELGDGATVHGSIIVNKDATIHGNLIVDGKVLAPDEESLTISSDYAILRKDAPGGLGGSMKSGLVIHNFDGNGSSASIATDNKGVFRVANTAVEHTTDYTNISYWADTGLYYEGLTTTQKEVETGAAVKQSADEYESVLYNDEYYHKTETNQWFKLYIDANNALTYNKEAPIEDTDLISALDELTVHQLIYYHNLSITVIDDSADQPILTRAEDNELYDKTPLMWDAANNKAVKIIDEPPAKKNLTIVSQIDNETGELSYKWGKSGGGAGAVLVMTQAEYDRRILITDMENEEYIPNNALVDISDAEDEYLKGEIQ